MPNEFHRRPDNLVAVRRDDGVAYVDTSANFELDYGQALPAMQWGATEQLYTQGQRHAYIVGNNVVAGGSIPYEYGDSAIAAINTLIANQAARQPPVPIP